MSLGWSDLPLILVIENPFILRTYKSYGLIVYAKDTQRWFLVKRRHSHSLIILLKGCFVEAAVPGLVENLTDIEVQNLIACLGSKDYLSRYLKETFNEDSLSSLEYVWGRFQISKELIIQALNQRDRSIPEPQWFWTKGQANSSPNKGYEENPQNAAFREFKEEAGIDLKMHIHHLKISKETFNHTINSHSGRIYSSSFWVVILENEIISPFPFDNIEVSDRRWFKTDEILKKIHLEYQKMFWKVLEYIKEN